MKFLTIFLMISSVSVLADEYKSDRCIDKLTDHNRRDSFTYSIDVDDINDRYFGNDHLAAAIHYVKAVLEIKGCSRDEVNFGRGAFGRSKSRCQYLAPGILTSLSCYVESNLGFFIIGRDLGTKVHVIYSRWD